MVIFLKKVVVALLAVAVVVGAGVAVAKEKESADPNIGGMKPIIAVKKG